MLRDIEHALGIGEQHGAVDADAGAPPQVPRARLLDEQAAWSARLSITPAKVHVREPLLALRRCLLTVVRDSDPDAPDRTLFDREIGSCWLMSAKLARDEGLVQAACVILFFRFRLCVLA